MQWVCWCTAKGSNEIDKIYEEFTGRPEDFEALAYQKKLTVEHEALGSDVNRLAQIFVEICENNRDRRDYTRAEIRRAIREVAAGFTIYRTYVIPQRGEIAEEDELRDRECRIDRQDAQDRSLIPALFDFIGDVLSLRVARRLGDEFLLRFQQFTAPVMAKGVEDTAFYCFNRMIGLNEVGASPERNGVTLEEFHAFCDRTHMLVSANDEYTFHARYQTLRRCASAAGSVDGDSCALAGSAAPVVAHEPALQSRANFPIATRNTFCIRR